MISIVQEHKEFTQMISGELPKGWDEALPSPTPEDKGKATRLHSQDCLNAAASVLPGILPLLVLLPVVPALDLCSCNQSQDFAPLKE